MSGILNKVFDKIIILIVAVLLIVGLREMILTDDLVGETFAELIGLLPFAEDIAEPITTLFKCAYDVPIVSDGNVASAILRLLIMACIQPLAMWVLSKFFLSIPSGLTGIYEREAHMDSFGYRAKELLINIIACPLLAFLAAWLSKILMNYLAGLGTIGSILTGLGVVLIGLGLSTIPLVTVGGMAFGLAILWRLLVTLLPKILEITVTNALCIAVYVAIVGGVQSQIVISIGTFLLWFVIWSFGFRLITSSLASANLFKS